jgi:hypothetical protein
MLALTAGIALTIPLRPVSPQDSARLATPRALIEVSVNPAEDGATLLGSLHITRDVYLYAGSHYGSAGDWRGFSIDGGVSFITQFHRKAGSYLRLGLRRQAESEVPAEPVEWRTKFMTDFGMYFRAGSIRPLIGFPVTWGKPWPEALDIVIGAAVSIPGPDR